MRVCLLHAYDMVHVNTHPAIRFTVLESGINFVEESTMCWQLVSVKREEQPSTLPRNKILPAKTINVGSDIVDIGYVFVFIDFLYQVIQQIFCFSRLIPKARQCANHYIPLCDA
jgi:hypothetical protein